MAENSHFVNVSVRFFKIILFVLLVGLYILKQLDNSPSLSMNDSQLDFALLTISAHNRQPGLVV